MLLRYVYIIRAANTNTYKIGITINPEQRLRQLQSSSPVDLAIVCAKNVDDAPGAELHIHTMYAANRKHLEWFTLKPKDVKTIVAYLSGNITAFEKTRSTYCIRCIYGCTRTCIEENYIPFSYTCDTHACTMYE